MSDALDSLLKRLSLANARRVWRDLCRRAEQEHWSYEQFLMVLAAEEIAQRSNTRVARLTRRAEFPFLKAVDEFNFTFQSTLRLQMMGSFLSPDFVSEGRNLILSGKPGRGKTHLAIAIAYKAIQNGFDAFFTTCAALIDELSGAASHKGRFREALAKYTHPDVLVIDEVGYLTYGNDAANVLFHVVNDRHIKRRPIIFTTNKNPKAWGRVLHDDDLAEVIVDRVLERGRHLKLDGPSFRTNKHPDLDTATVGDQDSAIISGTPPAEFPEPTLAIRAGNDDLAKQALLRKFEHEARSIEAAVCVEGARTRLEDLSHPLEMRASSSTSPVAVPAAVSHQRTSPRPDELQRRPRAHEREDQIRAVRNSNPDAALHALTAKMGASPTRDDDEDLDDFDDNFPVLVAFGKKKNWPN